jgi:hypothetical protein
MVTRYLSLCLVLLLPSVALPECRIVGYDSNGQQIIECNPQSGSLPVCGSEFDRGGKCIGLRPPGSGARNGSNGPQNYSRDQSATGSTPFNAGGPPPVNAGGSWPNRAQEYGSGRR